MPEPAHKSLISIRTWSPERQRAGPPVNNGEGRGDPSGGGALGRVRSKGFGGQYVWVFQIEHITRPPLRLGAPSLPLLVVCEPWQ